MNNNLIIALIILTGIALFTGCNKARIPGLVKCEGIVTWKGEPIEGAMVAFSPKNPSGRSAFGLTDANGKFKTTTLHVNDGIEPGEYVVTVTKMSSVREKNESLPESDFQDPEAARNMPGRGPDRVVDTYHIPQVYSDKATSGLTAVVPAKGTRDLAFELVGEITN